MQHWKPSSIKLVFHFLVFFRPLMKKIKPFICAVKEAYLRYHDKGEIRIRSLAYFTHKEQLSIYFQMIR